VATLAAALASCAEGDAAARSSAEAAFSAALGATASLLLLPNSRPLHAQLLGALARLPAPAFEPAVAALASRLRRAAQRHMDLDLAEALGSLFSVQPPHALGLAAADAVAVEAVASLARGAMSAHAAAAAGAPPSPAVADATHAALGAMYKLLARHCTGALSSPGDGHAALGAAADTCLACVQTPPLSRDAALTGAVVLLAPACAGLDAEAAARMLAAALFGQRFDDNASSPSPDSPLDALVLRPRGSSLAAECASLTPFGRLAMLKAAVAAAPPGAALRPLGPAGWSLLLDGALPELAQMLERTPCSHERYHALTGAAAGVTLLADSGTAAMPAPLRARLLALVWGGLEDPQPQVVRAGGALFEAMLRAAGGGGDARAAALDAALLLLRSGPRKGRFAPLAALVRRCGAGALLAARPALLPDALAECAEETLCAAAATFMRAVSDEFEAEQRAALGTDAAARAALDALWLPALLGALQRGGRVRAHCAKYVLPGLFARHAHLAAMLLRALGGQDTDAAAMAAEEDAAELAGLTIGDTVMGAAPVDSEHAACVVAVLRAGRSSRLSSPGGAHALLVSPGGTACVAAPERVLLCAATAADGDARADALELLCIHPRGAELPAAAEARVLRAALALALRGGGGAAARNRVSALLRRLLPRLHAGLERAAGLRAAPRRPSAPPSAGAAAQAAAGAEPRRAAAAKALVPWLLRAALRGAYPGAPFERKFAAVDAAAALAEAWSPAEAALRAQSGGDAWPYGANALSPAWLAALVAAGVDSWDAVRLRVAGLLACHAAPLPGLATAQQLAPLQGWAVRLARSPRAREADAAALLLRTLCEKYVVRLRWALPLNADGAGVEAPALDTPLPSAAAASARHLDALVDAIEADAVAAESQLVAAARHALAHGSLLALRLSLPALKLEAPGLAAEPDAEARVVHALERLMRLLARLTAVALAAVATPEAIGASAADVAPLPPGGVGLGTYFGSEGDESESDDDASGSDDEEGGRDDATAGLAPEAQMVMTAAWLTMKEVALCCGALAERTPSRLLPSRALAEAGASLVDVLLVTKHNGAVDKARQGLTQLAARLLSERDGGDGGHGERAPAAAPGAWAETLLARLLDPSQGVRDLIRRSAGLPAALLALCCAEPAGVARRILPRVLRCCLDAARDATLMPSDSTAYVPGVHAFNVLRALFADRALAADTGGALAEGVEAALDGFASPHWALRNAAGLAFAALCVRTTGTLNAPRRASKSARGLSASAFFGRFPPLHAVLLRQLRAGAAAATAGRPAPGLAQTLAMLARLRPADGDGVGAGAEALTLDTAPLVHGVLSAAGARHAFVRGLAARALVPLVPPARAGDAAAKLAAALPGAPRRDDPAAWAAWGGGGFNDLHGQLLQCAALVRSAADGGPGAARRLRRSGLAAALHRAAWLGDAARCGPPAVCGAFCDVLCALTAALDAEPDADSEEAEERGAETTVWRLAEQAASCAASAPAAGPGEALWRKSGATLATACALRCGNAAATTDALLRRLRGGSYEVRGAVLKALQRAAAAGRLRLPAAALRAGLAAALQGEAHPKCAARMLELLAALPAASSGEPDAPGWRALDAAASAARDGRHKASALRALGAAARRAPPDEAAAAAAAALRHIDAAGAYDAPADARAAAADALAASGLLTAPRGDAALHAWLLALRALEDEEEAAREPAAAAVAAALGRSGAGADAALEGAVAHAAMAHAGAPALHAWLLSACAGTPPASALRRGASLARRLFDREVDNHHAEPLLTAQLAARELRRAPLPADVAAAAAAQLASAAADAAPAFAKLHARAAWVGGVSNHADAFLPLYRTLLAAWALAPSLAGTESGGARLAADVAALAAQLLPLAPHPLLRDMALAAVDALPGCADALPADTAKAARCEADADFHPLFLLA